MGALEEQTILSSNEWEEVKRKGEGAIRNWIDNGLRYKQCTIVLVGQETALRPWVLYEIERSWTLKKGVCGIRIHGLKNIIRNGNPEIDQPGPNPFDKVDGVGFRASLHEVYGADSQQRYKYISDNIANWVEQAIANRKMW